MAVGANIKTGSRKKLWTKFMTILQNKQFRHSNHSMGSKVVIAYKEGVPADNTAADDPGNANAIVIDTTNNDIYICVAYTNSTTFDMLKITP